MEIESLKCRKIEIVDQNGKPRMILYGETDKSVILLLNDKGPTLQISSTGPNNVELHFMSGDVPRVTIGAFANGDAGLTVRDLAGKPRVIAGCDGQSDKARVWSENS